MPLRSVATLHDRRRTRRTGGLRDAAAADRRAGPVIVHRGQPVKVTVRTASLGLSRRGRYSDGSRAAAGIKHARRRPRHLDDSRPEQRLARPGRWTVRCGVTWQTDGPLARQAGSRDRQRSTPTPHVMVDKQGFSQRPDSLGTGSTVSYGLLLKNTSTTQDATSVYLLINFATAERRADRHGDADGRD